MADVPLASCWSGGVLVFIGWLVTGIGWFVSSCQANSRETRKEIRSKVDNLSQSLSDLVSSASGYYTETDPNAQFVKATTISIGIESCRRQIELMQDMDQKLQSLDSKFAELYDAITGDDFQTYNRAVTDTDREKCKRIAMLNQKVILALENWYSTKYKVNPARKG